MSTYLPVAEPASAPSGLDGSGAVGSDLERAPSGTAEAQPDDADGDRPADSGGVPDREAAR